jgi:hypothetical protein
LKPIAVFAVAPVTVITSYMLLSVTEITKVNVISNVVRSTFCVYVSFCPSFRTIFSILSLTGRMHKGDRITKAEQIPTIATVTKKLEPYGASKMFCVFMIVSTLGF